MIRYSALSQGADLKAAIIGCGNISETYARNLVERLSLEIELVACCDRNPEKAATLAERFGIKLHGDVDLAFTADEIELLVVLTQPQEHRALIEKALAVGKHVYSEKPLCSSSTEAQQLLAEGKRKALRVAAAPDTVLGAGVQTARHAIDSGTLGSIFAGAAAMIVPPPETWHPKPFFLYGEGGGPLYDMGPYYLATLVWLLGPIRRVNARGLQGLRSRTVGSGPYAGARIEVQVTTHVYGWLEFDGGVVVSLVMSFDTAGSRLPHVELYGENGTISVPDPNTFGGEVEVRLRDSEHWRVLEPVNLWTSNCRGLGVSELAEAIRDERPSRVEGDIASHVLEAIELMLEAARSECWQALANPSMLHLEPYR